MAGWESPHDRNVLSTRNESTTETVDDSRADSALGILYIVATPIGNLRDVTLRALDVFRQATLILAEDTRRTSILLRTYGISTPLLSYNEHNQRRRAEQVRAALHRGAVALVTDAGTPLVSDPGSSAVALALSTGARVVPIPGANAPLAALVASGLPSERFYFGGFLPRRPGDRRRCLESVHDLDATLIFFEAPHRLASCVAALAETLGDRPAALCTELTKLYEECRRAPLAQLAAQLAAEPVQRGEWTIVVAPPSATTPTPASAAVSATAGKADSALHDMAELVRDGMPPALAARQVARAHNLARRALYARWITAQQESTP